MTDVNGEAHSSVIVLRRRSGWIAAAGNPLTGFSGHHRPRVPRAWPRLRCELGPGVLRDPSNGSQLGRKGPRSWNSQPATQFRGNRRSSADRVSGQGACGLTARAGSDQRRVNPVAGASIYRDFGEPTHGARPVWPRLGTRSSIWKAAGCSSCTKVQERGSRSGRHLLNWAVWRKRWPSMWS